MIYKYNLFTNTNESKNTNSNAVADGSCPWLSRGCVIASTANDSWSPNSTDLYFWYLVVDRQIQKNTAGQSLFVDRQSSRMLPMIGNMILQFYDPRGP